MGVRESLQPGDLIADRNGYPVVRHWHELVVERWILSPRGLYVKYVEGEISAEEWVDSTAHHAEVGKAYDMDLPLPEGATIVPPTVEEIKSCANMFSVDLFYKAMRHARESHQI